MSDPFHVHMDADGRPFLTRNNNVEPYKSSYPQRLQPQQYRDVHIDILDLSIPEELEYYSRIWQAVGCGVAAVSAEDRRWIEDKGTWKVLIRWFLTATMDPQELRQEKTRAVASALAGDRQ